MNLKTTFVLLVLVVAGGVLFALSLVSKPPAAPDAGTKTTIREEFEPDKIRRISIQRAQDKKPSVELERGAGEWTLPGKWPTRKREVEQLVEVLSTELNSEFAPIPLADDSAESLKPYGLDQPKLILKVQTGDDDYRLALGEEPAKEDDPRAVRPVYLRMGKKMEVVRLDPGLLAALDRPLDYYQQRRLFPSERVAKEGPRPEKVERLVAKALAVEEKPGGGRFTWLGTPLDPAPEGDQPRKKTGTRFTLDRAKGEWELAAPVKDRPDPDKLNTILAAVPDIWAEHFVDRNGKDLGEFGLKQPEQILTVTPLKGEPVTLWIGKESPRVTRRKVPPPPTPPGMPPRPPIDQTVLEKYRYAKLAGNDQIFEIKADKLPEVFVRLDSLRDNQLARFRPADARRIEISQSGQDIVLVKKGDRWRLEKPLDTDAETTPVTDLLDALSRLQTRGSEDVLDHQNAREFGLDAPAGTIKVTVEEEGKGAAEEKTKKTRTVTVKVGKHDAAQHKLYVQVDGRDRINAVEDNLAKLVHKPALAYRGRRIFDFTRDKVEQIAVKRGDESYQLKQTRGAWQLTAPVTAEADAKKADQLLDDLSQLEAIEYVNDAPKPEALEKDYGLDKSALSATLTFTDKDKPARTLLIGKQRENKPEYFARLDDKDRPAVFVVKKQVRDALDQSSLQFRPLELWKLKPEEIGALKIQRQEDPEYRLTRGEGAVKAAWKLTGPFDATVSAAQVSTMVNDLAPLRCERYVAHGAADKELATYGLDKPFLRVTVQPASKQADAADKKPAPERVLLIGKPSADGAMSRFGRLGDDSAVFVVGEPVVAALNHSALELLDRNLLTLSIKDINRIKSVQGGQTLTLQHKDNQWQVDSSAGKFTADGEAMANALGLWSLLRAQRFAAYGDKVDWAKYGLDKPAGTITVTVQPSAPEGEAAPKSTDHTVSLGKEVEGSDGERYARLDKLPGVIVLAPRTVSELSRPYLDFVDRTLWKLDPSDVTGLQRRLGGEELELTKQADGWQLVKPAAHRADETRVDDLVKELARLRATRIAAYPAKDLKEFGLDEPFATFTVVQTVDGKPANRVLKIGKTTGEKETDRFVQAEGSTAIGVLAGPLVDRLLAPPVKFRDRRLAQFADADKAILERGPRKAVFTRIDGNWKMTQPLEADAEQSDLDELINALARLRADELVAEKPADLKPYGLDKPELHWRLQSGDKEVLHLLVGAREKSKQGEGKRCYARLAGGDVVALLDPKVTGRVLGEYRKVSLWPALDAAQVEALQYGYPKNPFVLEKIDQSWQVAGKPAVKVEPSAVSDTLAALAGLRAERVVVDKDADLKLYGLEPPQLVLEVQTRTAKQTMHIGRHEGNSKRYYARVPGPNRSEVFTISAADGARIVRDLAAFSQAVEKPPKVEP